jgi:hypothetical protein
MKDQSIVVAAPVAQVQRTTICARRARAEHSQPHPRGSAGANG